MHAVVFVLGGFHRCYFACFIDLTICLLMIVSQSFFPAMTKIVGTLGPRSRSVDIISGCLKAGMSGIHLFFLFSPFESVSFHVFFFFFNSLCF